MCPGPFTQSENAAQLCQIVTTSVTAERCVALMAAKRQVTTYGRLRSTA